MRTLTAILLLISTALFAQYDPGGNNLPGYKIELTTANENKLKGLLLQVKDSSLLIYPGKKKEWRRKTQYQPVEFGYANIRQIKLKKKNRTLRGMLIGGGIGTAIFAGSLLISNQAENNHHAFFTFFAIPAGLITGILAGSASKKTFHINGSIGGFDQFQKTIQ